MNTTLKYSNPAGNNPETTVHINDVAEIPVTSNSFFKSLTGCYGKLTVRSLQIYVSVVIVFHLLLSIALQIFSCQKSHWLVWTLGGNEPLELMEWISENNASVQVFKFRFECLDYFNFHLIVICVGGIGGSKN